MYQHRVLKRGQDNRFDEIRRDFWKFAGFWTFQLVWVWIVSWPVIILNSPAVSGLTRLNNGSDTELGLRTFGSATDVVGLVAWVCGLVIETLADLDKYRWKESNPKSDLPVCRVGFWKWSRHPVRSLSFFLLAFHHLNHCLGDIETYQWHSLFSTLSHVRSFLVLTRIFDRITLENYCYGGEFG